MVGLKVGLMADKKVVNLVPMMVEDLVGQTVDWLAAWKVVSKVDKMVEHLVVMLVDDLVEMMDVRLVGS